MKYTKVGKDKKEKDEGMDFYDEEGRFVESTPISPLFRTKCFFQKVSQLVTFQSNIREIFE